VDGSVFCSGLDASKLLDDVHPRLRALISPVTYLIRHTTFWPRSAASHTGAFSLKIRPLPELVDMYHTHEATNPLDKVYALLGMCSDNPETVELSANYGASWEDIFHKIIRFSLSERISVGLWGDKQTVAVIRGKGRILGKVSWVQRSDSRGDVQNVHITWKNAYGGFDTEGEGRSLLPFQASAKPIQVGDAVCLLEEASEPTIVRLCDSYSAIIMIQAPLTSTNSERLEHLRRTIVSWTDLVLVWDWEVPQYEQGRDYESFMGRQGGPETRHSALRDNQDKVVRLWNFGILLNGVERYQDSGNILRKAVKMHSTAPRSANVHSGYSPSEKENKEVLSVIQDLSHGCQGADIKEKDWGGQTPLWWALIQGHEVMVKLLRERGANTEAKNQDGRTPLWWALERGCEATVKLLLKEGANIEAKNEYSDTPLSWASRYGREAMVDLLLRRGADIEAKDQSGRTPLLLASRDGHDAVVKLLLERGADIEAKDQSGRTPLLLASRDGHDTVVKLLLKRGADIEAKNQSGQTPLLLASRDSHDTVVKLLLKKGADIEVKDQSGQTPLLFASRYGHDAVVKLLLKRGADIEAKDPTGKTPLFLASQDGYDTVVKLLLERGADIEAKDQSGRTPLLVASRDGYDAVVKLLLERGADIGAEGDIGRAPNGGPATLDWRYTE
jgi:ankyrin repeat protein